MAMRTPWIRWAWPSFAQRKRRSRDIKMTLRYAHLEPSHLRAGIQALEQRNAGAPAGLALSTEPRVTPVSQDFAGIA